MFDDIILAVVKHYPQYDLTKALETESLSLGLLYADIPDKQHIYSWPFIQLQTFMGNALGGKGKGDSEKPDPGSVWSPEEFAPAFQPRSLDSLPQPFFEPQHCYALTEAIEAGLLPSWCIQFVGREDSLERVQQVGAGYAALLENDK